MANAAGAAGRFLGAQCPAKRKTRRARLVSQTAPSTSITAAGSHRTCYSPTNLHWEQGNLKGLQIATTVTLYALENHYNC